MSGKPSKTTTRIRKRSVRFGNPSMFTYHGSVHTIEDQGGGSSSSSSSSSTGGTYTTAGVGQAALSQPPSSFTQRPLVEGASPVENLVAMVQVPPEQVPEGVLNLARAHRSWINHVRIVIEDSSTSSTGGMEHEYYGKQEECDDFNDDGTTDDHHHGSIANPSSTYAMVSSPTASAVENAASILAAEQQVEHQRAAVAMDHTTPFGKSESLSLNQQQQEPQQPSSSRTYLVLFEMCDAPAADQLVQCLHGQPYTCLDETQRCHLYHVVALQGDDGVSLMSPFFALSTKSSVGGRLEIVPSASSSDSLDTNKGDSAAAAAATTTTHDGGPSQRHHHSSEDYNCAVCLEHMELDWAPSKGERTSILTTVCNHSFHMDCLLQWQDSPCPVCRYDHSGLNEALSRCHVCDTTDHNFVCLICGVVSCGGAGAVAAAAAAATAAAAADPSSSSSASSAETQQQQQQQQQQQLPASSHAKQHYDETLHAYALDTETQHVWDFAGAGYVHRLLQNKDDGKLVEVNDPTNTTSHERALNPGLSEAQEGEVVHRKLEGFASQYYTLLKSQLEQQRTYYEGRLEEIRREHVKKDRPRKQTSDLIGALKHERHQLAQRLSTLKTRRDKVRADVAFLKHMNESLEENKNGFRQRLQDAQKNRIDIRRVFETLLPPLQDKVMALMLQLECDVQDTHDLARKPASSKRSK